MAPRTSSRQIAAREQARERAATYAAREHQLVQLAEAFFLADGEAQDVLEAAEARIAAVRQQADQDVAATRVKAAAVAEQMLATGAPLGQVADRLGMSVGELRRVRAVAVVDDGAGARNGARRGPGSSPGADRSIELDAVSDGLPAAAPAAARTSAAV